MAYSAQQIAQLAYNAGFRGSALRMAVAIALAESSGNPSAYNPEAAAGTPKGSGSRGLWQIYGKAHPEYNTDAMFNPQANANAAFKVYQEAGNSFRPWSTYNNGSAYKIAQGLNLDTSSATLTQGAPLITSAIGGGLSAITGGALSPQVLQTAVGAMPGVAGGLLSSGGSLFNIQLLPQSVSDTLSSPDFPKTVLVGSLGFLLFTIGLIMIVVQLSAPLVEPATKVAVKAATGGIV